MNQLEMAECLVEQSKWSLKRARENMEKAIKEYNEAEGACLTARITLKEIKAKIAQGASSARK